MKKEKQDLLLRILDNGKYEISGEMGVILSYRKNTDSFELLRPNKLPSGYLQNVLFLGRFKDKKIIVYTHVAVWISINGPYDEGMVINHKDLDKSNNAISNLELVSQKENIAHALKNVRYKETGINRNIRAEDIVSIKEMMSRGIKNQSRIARELGLGRLAVRYTIKNIEAGKELKFEKAFRNLI